jgi:hypothetical protein
VVPIRREDLEAKVSVLSKLVGARKFDDPPTKFLGRECLLEAQYAHRGNQSAEMIVQPEEKQLPLALVPIGAQRLVSNGPMAEGG